MKAVILARVSTEEQKEAGNSLPAQQVRLRNYIQKSSHLTPDKEYIFDESASKEKRQRFDEVIDYLCSFKETVALCCDKVDRLTRNFLIGLPKLEELRRSGKIELHFPSDNLVLHRESPATDLFHFNIAVSLAQYYSNAISDNTKRAFEQKRRNGEWTGKVCLGYKNVPLDAEKRLRADIVIDPERGHLIEKMFEMYATGNYSLETIRHEITKMGLRSMRGFELTKSHVENILKDSFYCGIAYSRKYGSYEHRYRRLITKALFDKCQQIREQRKKTPNKEVSKDFIFKGITHCKKCGCLYTPEIKKGKFVYYSCTNGKHKCKREYIPERILLKPVYEVFEAFKSLPKAVQDKLVERLRKLNESEAVYHKKEIERIRSEYDRVQNKVLRLLDFLIAEGITKDDYDKKLQELKDRQNLLNIEMEEHTTADHDFHIHVSTVINLSRRVKEIFDSSEVHEKRALLRFLLQNPVADGRKLEFELRKPFDTILQLAHSPSWLRDQGSNLGYPR